jgi:hypothetical protein
MPTKRIDTTILPDGTLEVRTPDDGQPYFAESRARADTELQTALDAMRTGGVPRPVLFQLGDDSARDRAGWKVLLPSLRQHGVATWNAWGTGGDDDYHYVMRPDIAREVLRGVLKVSNAGRFFRVPRFPAGYWTVSLEGGRVAVFESQTFKDTASSEER